MTRLAHPRRPAPDQSGMPYEDFLARYSGGEHVEWVDGEVVAMVAVTVDHAGLQGFLLAVMKHVAESRDSGQVLSDPFQMKTGPDLPGRAPDVMFVARESLGRLHRLYLEGPADLVIEIVSPTSRTTDRVHKFREYETGGVPEY
jgi:Uma2 family endonuclease